MIVDRSEALKILEPYLVTIRNCVRTAVEYYFSEIPAEVRTWYSARSRASIIYDAMVQIARRELSAMPSVRLRDRRGYLEVFIDGRLNLRLKKLNRHLRPSYIPTQQVYEFMHQIQFDFPDAPPSLTNIIAGYKWNATQTDLEGVYIVCPDGSTNAWDINLESELAVVAPEPAELPVIPIQERPRRRAVAKERPALQGAAGDENES